MLDKRDGMAKEMHCEGKEWGMQTEQIRKSTTRDVEQQDAGDTNGSKDL